MSMGKLKTIAALMGCTLICAGAILAQGRGGGASWVTGSADAQRTAWLRTDPQINKAAVENGVMQFLWKLKINNTSQQLNALTPPVFSGRIISYKGFKDPIYLSGSGDSVYAIDDPLGKIFWETKLPYQVTYPQQKGGTLDCPGGLTSGMSMSVGLGGPPQAPPPAPPAAARGGNDPAGGRGPAVAGFGGARGPAVVYALTSDGLIHAINQHTGLDSVPGVKIVKGNANARGLIVVNNTGYVTTSNKCGSVFNGVYSIDLAAQVKALSVNSWLSGDASVAGASGVAFGTDGTVYAATTAGPYDPASNQFGGAIVSLQEKALRLKSNYAAPGASFSTTPVVFTTGGKQFVTAATQDGRIHLVDAASMVGVGTSTVFSTSKTVAPSALATFEEAGGTRFILAPANGPLGTATKYATSNGAVTGGAIVAFKVVDQDGKTTLQPAWSSRDIPAPSAPIVVNGVVFVLATGEYTPPAGSTLSAALRAQRSTPAVLYALDAATGKELWNSGKAITSFSRAPLAVTASKIIVSTHDNTVYAFGYKLLMD